MRLTCTNRARMRQILTALRSQDLCGAEQEAPIYIFVAVVPVTMDAYFKLWIFRGLNRKNPAAAVTLKSMDRH